ncbi:MAG: hypothetical protein COA44_15655 [Arcobacter sp.]|nr:MAG: hypothetical protein COA44_15655 [Arcobacter sp.]
MRDLTQHLTTRADDSRAAPVFMFLERHSCISTGFNQCQGLVRFFAYLRIKPVWNMVGALWLLPALARYLVRPEKYAGK